MKQQLKIQGNRTFFKGASQKFQDLVEEEIFATNEDIANKARSRVPVDTGILKNAIKTETKGLEAETSVRLEYAPYIEFGTGGLVDVPAGLEDYAIQFKGKGIKQVNIPPQPFLFNSWFEETQLMLERLKKQIDNAS